MAKAQAATRIHNLLPRLAVTALVCWVLGTHTYFDSANIPTGTLWRSHAQTTPEGLFEAKGSSSLRVLSERDVKLYREAFAAQAQGDLKTADRSLNKLRDTRLVGHVLADRYLRHTPSAEQLRVWLETYADLPEAIEIYDKAVALAGKGANIPAPTTGNVWTGNDGYVTAFGFRSVSTDRKASPASRNFVAKLNKALREGKPVVAEKMLETEQKHHKLAPQEVAMAQGMIAANYFYKGQTIYARHMANEGAKRQNPLALWIAGLTAWKQNDASSASKSFTLLAAQSDLTGWDRAAASFWAWRSLKRMGDTRNARYWLDQAARHSHSFYGLMAAHLLDHDVNWSWELPKVSTEQIALLTNIKSGGRALALLQIDQRDLAERELRHINLQGRRDLQDAMLALATDKRMPSLILQLGGVATKANGDPYDAALYPVPPWQPAGGFTVDRALLYALIRHESQFDPTAVSDRGACGLMQLLPATAKLMAYDEGKHLSRDCSGNLLDPSINMALGQRYVEHLAEQPLIGNNLLLLLAAYNSGPNKLARWMHEDDKDIKYVVSHRKAFEKADPLLFIESMPVRQTHDYVMQVLIHYWFYRARLGETQSSLTELANGQWPRLAPSEEQHRPLPKGTKEAMLEQGGIRLADNSN